jgi:hydrogenase expression/formation protein HypE
MTTPVCPVPLLRHTRIQVAHGGGGRLMRDLIEGVFLPAFGNPLLETRHDAAVLEVMTGSIRPRRLAFTTDSYVVSPLFFPGGDIGSLSVNGTVNDLAMAGARPLYLSAAFIVEEGFAVADIERVARSMRVAADAVGVRIVTGDTKVVDRGKGDGLFITTSGVGVLDHHATIAPAAIQEGDVILLSGDVGRHGIAILAARESVGFETPLESDCAPLVAPVLALLEAGVEVHCLRDLTRGGLAAAVVEIAETARGRLELDEAAIPVSAPVDAACELLGLDPLHVANEGRFVAFVAAPDAERARGILRRHRVSAAAEIVGRVASRGEGWRVTLRTRLGSTRIVDLPSGEQLPRIC